MVVDNRNLTLPETLKENGRGASAAPRDWIRWRGVDRNADRQRSCGQPADFRWRYFNADGSEVEVRKRRDVWSRFAIDQVNRPNCTFETQSGIVRAQLRDTAGHKSSGWTSRTLKSPRSTCIDLGVILGLHAVAVGVPHVVLVVDDADSWPSHREFHETGAAIRRHPQFAPAGTNVECHFLARRWLAARGTP